MRGGHPGATPHTLPHTHSLTQSTYCQTVAAHLETIGRRVAVINLDPAAEDTAYAAAADVRDLITVEDAMEELGLGPNG